MRKEGADPNASPEGSHLSLLLIGSSGPPWADAGGPAPQGRSG